MRQDDERKPRGKDRKTKGARYTRDFGVPKDNAQERFTDAAGPCSVPEAARLWPQRAHCGG